MKIIEGNLALKGNEKIAIINARFNPGVFGNLKGLVGQNNDDSFENKAISANVKEIVDTIKGMK